MGQINLGWVFRSSSKQLNCERKCVCAYMYFSKQLPTKNYLSPLLNYLTICFWCCLGTFFLTQKKKKPKHTCYFLNSTVTKIVFGIKTLWLNKHWIPITTSFLILHCDMEILIILINSQAYYLMLEQDSQKCHEWNRPWPKQLGVPHHDLKYEIWGLFYKDWLYIGQ